MPGSQEAFTHVHIRDQIVSFLGPALIKNFSYVIFMYFIFQTVCLSGADRCTKWPTCSLPEGSLDFWTKVAKGM